MDQTMKSFSPALLAILLGTSLPAAHADQALAQKKVCLSCHGVDRRTGFPAPSFREVAAKYANDPKAADRLASKVMQGGTGVWGVMTMPANPQVNAAEAQQLVNWVLSLR